MEAGNPEAALPHLKAALKSNPAEAQFWISYIDALIEAKRLPEARATFKEIQAPGFG